MLHIHVDFNLSEPTLHAHVETSTGKLVLKLTWSRNDCFRDDAFLFVSLVTCNTWKLAFKPSERWKCKNICAHQGSEKGKRERESKGEREMAKGAKVRGEGL